MEELETMSEGEMTRILLTSGIWPWMRGSESTAARRFRSKTVRRRAAGRVTSGGSVERMTRPYAGASVSSTSSMPYCKKQSTECWKNNVRFSQMTESNQSINQWVIERSINQSIDGRLNDQSINQWVIERFFKKNLRWRWFVEASAWEPAWS